MRIALAVLLLVVSVSQTGRYVRVWRADLTLWQHAVWAAPLKPRPRLQYARTLMINQRMAEGLDQLAVAEVLLAQPHLPLWDVLDGWEQVRRLGGLRPLTGPMAGR